MVSVFVLGPESFERELRGEAELHDRRFEIAPLQQATVVVSDVQSFSSMSPTRRQEVIEGRVGLVASDQLDPSLILRSHLEGWLAVAKHQLLSVLDAGVDDVDPRIRMLALLDRKRRGLQTISLADGEWSILETLLGCWGACVAASELAEKALRRSDRAAVTLVWKYVSRLRLRLNGWSVTIESVPGKGYRMARSRGSQ